MLQIKKKKRRGGQKKAPKKKTPEGFKYVAKIKRLLIPALFQRLWSCTFCLV